MTILELMLIGAITGLGASGIAAFVVKLSGLYSQQNMLDLMSNLISGTFIGIIVGLAIFILTLLFPWPKQSFIDLTVICSFVAMFGGSLSYYQVKNSASRQSRFLNR